MVSVVGSPSGVDEALAATVGQASRDRVNAEGGHGFGRWVSQWCR
jgi:hypothetical protein